MNVRWTVLLFDTHVSFIWCVIAGLPRILSRSGFWPSIGNDGPCTCSSEKFSPNVVCLRCVHGRCCIPSPSRVLALQISSLMPDMQKYWPSYQQSDDTFWAHEYEKHGTCASSITRLSTQFDFFETTLQLTKQYNAIPMLAKGGGIKPSDSTRYNTADAQTAIKKAFGGIPAFTCKSSKLDSVYLCFSKSLQPMDCPGLKNTCGSSFLIPASRQAEREDEGIAQA